jgi:hypothetical protein
VLEPREIKEELVPLLIKTFAQENTEMRVSIIKCFPQLLEHIGHPNNATVLLEFLVDVLCVFEDQELRK